MKDCTWLTARCVGRALWCLTATFLSTLACSAAEPAATEAGADFLSSIPETAYRVGCFALWVLAGLAGFRIARVALRRLALRSPGKTIPVSRRLSVLHGVCSPLPWVILWFALASGLHVCILAHIEAVQQSGWKILHGVFYAGLVASITWLVYAVTHAVLESYARGMVSLPDEAHIQRFLSVFRKTAKILLGFLALTVVLDHFGIQITGFLATAGVASLAVAFAAQETLANMISGFVLTIDRPFREGDRVELANGKIGDVLEVGWRSTKILSFDDTVIAIPNSEIAKSQVINLSAPTPRFKIRAPLGVAYGSDLGKVKGILLDVFAAHPKVLKDPPPAVYFTAFGDSSLDLLRECWIADCRDRNRILDELNMAIKDRFEKDGIEIPFPQREIRLRQ